MRERLEELLADVARRDVGADLPCRVRPDPPPRGAEARLPLELHDLRPGRPGPARQAVPGGARPRSEAVRPARHPRADLERQEPAGRRRTSTGSGSRPSTTRRSPTSTSLYQRRLFAANAVDFDDLLMLTVEVLERFPEARRALAEGLPLRPRRRVPGHEPRAVPALQLLAGKHRNVCAVGDPDQSIYAFRGADIRNILEFERDFAGAQLIALEQNYRSTNSILRAANAVIANNRERKPKNLWSELGEGDPVRVFEVEDEHAEARFVASEIAALVDEGCVGARDRGLLPDERAVAGAGGRPRPAGDPVPGDRRAALLRAGRDQGRDRLSAGDRQPLRRRLAARGSRTARAAESATRRSPACRPSRTRRASRSGRRSSEREEAGLGAGAAQGRRRAFGR